MRASNQPTRQFMSVLPRGVTASSLADDCRSAALGFVAGAALWDKRHLAEWLEQSYRPVTVGVAPAHESPLRKLARPAVDARRVELTVEAARQAVIAVLRSMSDSASVAQFGAFAIRSGLVHRCIDENGEPAWAPRAKAHIKLADRVLSLFAADCLARPWDYETLLVVCEDCDSVRLVEHASCCNRRSGVMLRGSGVDARESAA